MPPSLPFPALPPDDPDLLILGTFMQNQDTTVSLVIGADAAGCSSEQVGVLARGGTVTAGPVGGHLPTNPRTVAHLLLVDPGGPTRVRRLTTHQTIAALLPHISVPIEGAPRLQALEALIQHVGGGLAIQSTGSWDANLIPPPEEMDHELVDPLSTSTAHHVLVDTEAMAGPPEGYEFQNAARTLALAPFERALITDEGIFLQMPERILTLSGLGAFIWEYLHRKRTAGIPDILAAALDALGDHSNAQVLVRNAVSALVGVGAVARNWVIIGGNSLRPAGHSPHKEGTR